MARQFSNNASSTLAASIVPADTTILIQGSDAAEFPTLSGSNTFDITIHEGAKIEIASCTARTGATLTVVRGQQGTSAESFTTNAVVEHRLTAGALTAWETISGIITTQGDLIQGGTGGAPERLALSGVMLGVSGGKWAGRTAAEARGDLDVPSTTEAVLDTLIDAKGDILVGTAADTIARKAVGTNAHVLSPNSANSDGLEWRAHPRGEVSNLYITQTPGSEAASVTITADAIDIEGYRATSVNVAASLAVSGLAGLDTGSEAANTTYYLWLIRKSSDGTVGAIFSLSATAPTMPAEYDQKRLVGHRRNDGSSNMIRQVQCNDLVLCAATSLGTGMTADTDLDTSNFCPAAVADFVQLGVRINSVNWQFDDKDDASISYGPIVLAGNMPPGRAWVRKNASNLVTLNEVAGADTVGEVYLLGWKVKVL